MSTSSDKNSGTHALILRTIFLQFVGRFWCSLQSFYKIKWLFQFPAYANCGRMSLIIRTSDEKELWCSRWSHFLMDRRLTLCSSYINSALRKKNSQQICWQTFYCRSEPVRPVEGRRQRHHSTLLYVLRGHSDVSERVASGPYVHQWSRTAFLRLWSGDLSLIHIWRCRRRG